MFVSGIPPRTTGVGGRPTLCVVWRRFGAVGTVVLFAAASGGGGLGSGGSAPAALAQQTSVASAAADASGGGVDPAKARSDPRLVRGLAVYETRFCGFCHRFALAGTAGTFGPPHDGLRAIATLRVVADDYTGTAATAADYVRESIVSPAAYVVPGFVSGWSRMPTYVDLTEEEIEALIELLLYEE